MVKRVLYGIGITGVLGAGLIVAAFLRDMSRAHQRVQDRSQIVTSPYGNIEYAEGGSGPAVLVVHGSGGGFDQGALIAEALLGERFHWIAPSRFGYLRSTFREGATFDDQADAYAYLLDALRIERAAVVTISHGGPSALLLAVRHPDRVSSLTLISAGVASSDDPGQAQANAQGRALMTIFQHDSFYWALTTAFRSRFMSLMGASDAVVARLTPEQRAIIDRLIDFMNPVSLRSAGTVFDNTAAMPNGRIAAVRAPTLVLHAKDDTLQLYRNAEFAAANIPGARLVAFETGGHLLMAVEQATIQTEMARHILEHTASP